MGEFEDVVAEIADAGLLTEKQAAAYVGREIDHASREQVAAHLDIAPSTLDTHRRTAVDKIEAAEATLELLEEYEARRYPEPPEECTECGAALGGRFATDEDHNPLCLDCAGVGSE